MYGNIQGEQYFLNIKIKIENNFIILNKNI
jgi:hypothetical protein